MSEFPIEEASIPLFEEFVGLRTALVDHNYIQAIEHLQQAFNDLMEQQRYQDALTLHEAILQALPETSEVNELRLWCLLGVGNACFHLDRDAEAEAAYIRMRDGARDVEDGYLHAVAVTRLGDLARKRGQSDAADQFYQESINIRVEIGDFFGAIETLLYLTMSREHFEQLDQAKAALQAAEKILKSLRRTVFKTQIPDFEQSYQHWEMAIWFQRASLMRAEGNLLGAARTYRKALKAAQELQDAAAEAKLLQNLANNEVEQGRATRALPLYERSLSLARANSLRQTMREVQLGLAIVLFRLKRYEESLPLYEAVCDAAKQDGDLHRWASLVADAGAVCLEAGLLDRARRLLDEALSHFTIYENTPDQERIMHNLLVVDARRRDMESLETDLHDCLNLFPQSAFAQRGSLYRLAGNLCLDLMGDPTSGARYFRQAVEEAATLGNAFQAGQTAALAAASLSDVGALQEALSLFDRSAELFAQIGDISNLWRTRNDRGNVFARMGCHEEAVEEYAWCLQAARERQDQILEAQALLNFSEVKRRMGEIEGALSHVGRSLDLYRTMEDQEGELAALNGMGLCLLDVGLYRDTELTEEALVLFEQALTLAKYRKDRSEEAMATRGLANVAERSGEISKALRLFLRAADIWEREGDVAHSAEAMASRVTLQVIQFDPRRWQRDTNRLIQLAVKAGRIGTASRGIVGAAGHLMQAGLLEAAVSVTLLAVSLHQYPTALTAQEAELEKREAADDLDDILVYLIDGMELWMSPQDRSEFLERLTDPENFANAHNGTDLRDSIESIRNELIAQGRYSQT